MLIYFCQQCDTERFGLANVCYCVHWAFDSVMIQLIMSRENRIIENFVHNIKVFQLPDWNKSPL